MRNRICGLVGLLVLFNTMQVTSRPVLDHDRSSTLVSLSHAVGSGLLFFGVGAGIVAGLRCGLIDLKRQNRRFEDTKQQLRLINQLLRSG